MVFLCRVNTGSQANRSGHGFRVDPCPKENLRTSNPKVSWQSDSRELAFALKFLKAGSFSSFHRNAGFPSLCSKLGKAGNLKEYEQRHMFSPHCAIGKGKKSYFVKITLSASSGSIYPIDIYNIYIYIYTHTHTHTYIYIYTHTHTHTKHMACC